MYAIISDIHSNTEALDAVLADIHSQGIDEILCLGDVVGYGPEPEECIDRIEASCRFCLSGNHDYAVLTRAERFNPLAEEAVDFTRQRLKPGLFKGGWYKRLFGAGPRVKARWRFLENLFLEKRENDVLYVHGSPRDQRNEYILETDITYGNVEKMQEIFQMIPHLCFVGHSHVPGIFIDASEPRFLSPTEMSGPYELDANHKYIVNIGSVGQPRDGDNRSCYVVVDGARVIYRRVPYNYLATMEKIRQMGPLSAQHCDRIAQGR